MMPIGKQMKNGPITFACVLLVSLVCFFCPGRAMATQHAADSDAADLIFVIDNSGSMRKNDPNFMTPKTVEAFLNELPPRTRVGMVVFDEKARLLEPLRPVDDPTARKRLSTSLGAIDYRGKFTNSAAGIERALYELKTQGTDQTKGSIIFLTDGIVDTGNSQKDAELTQWLKNDLAEESRRLGIRIFGIAFTENADYVLIQALAVRTEGGYFRAYQPDDIATVLSDILTRLRPPEPEIEPVQAAPATVPRIEPLAPLESPAALEPKPSLDETDTQQGREQAPQSSGTGLRFFIIVFVVLGILLYCIYRFLMPAGRGNAKKTPAQVSPERPEAKDKKPSIPEWQLHDLSKPQNSACSFDQARVTIGRDAKNDFVVPRQTISNLHAIIEFKEGAFFLEDLRSTNGTRLNDRRINTNKPMRLKSGDRISFASHEFKFVRMDQLISGDTIMMAVTEMGSDEETSDFSSPAVTVEDEEHLASSLKKHLKQIIALGAKYKTFSDQYFTKDIIRTLSVQAHENMQRTKSDNDQHCSPLIKGNAFYVVCTLPVAIAETADWFEKRFGGFTKFIFKWIQSEAYDVTSCDVFCIVTFGLKQTPWVSMTIVPTHDADDSVEIMSVDFLTDQEKITLALDFDDHGRVV